MDRRQKENFGGRRPLIPAASSAATKPIREMFDALVPEYDRFNRLSSLGMDVLWRREVVRSRQEKRNKLNDAAAPTAVTDGVNVYAFFADFGLVSFSSSGEERWRMELPPMPSMQGVAASPILAGNKLLLVVDQAQNSYMLALDVRNGETLWRKQRKPAPGGAYASPVRFS